MKGSQEFRSGEFGRQYWHPVPTPVLIHYDHVPVYQSHISLMIQNASLHLQGVWSSNVVNVPYAHISPLSRMYASVPRFSEWFYWPDNDVLQVPRVFLAKPTNELEFSITRIIVYQDNLKFIQVLLFDNRIKETPQIPLPSIARCQCADFDHLP
ncbi:MAG: hypothetical protein ABSF61_04000 [Anaerolineales bacterium]|jgi:hypothetical protein